MKFTDICRQYGIQVAPSGHEHVRAGWIQIECPYCRLQGHWRLGYNIAHGHCNCWTCGPHNTAQALADITGEPYRVFSALLDKLERTEAFLPTKKRGKLVLPKGIGRLEHAHIRYLSKRQLDISQLEQLWKLQGIGLAAKLQWRIFIPVYFQGQVVSWTTRSISDNVRLRYISASPEQEMMDHKKLLFGMDYVRHAVIVCEGPFDVFKIGPGAVATFGTGYSKAQLLALSAIPNRYVCFDAEPQAQRRARDLCDSLAVYPGETSNIILDSKDAAESSSFEIAQLRRLLE